MLVALACHEAGEHESDSENEDAKWLDELLLENGCPCCPERVDVKGAMGVPSDEPPGETSNGGPSERLCFIEDEESHDIMMATEPETRKVRVAIDSGSTANVIHPKELPAGIVVTPYTGDVHFRGANNSRIERYGSVVTRLKNEFGSVGCGWEAADVHKALHSVSQVCGPEEDEIGKQDVLFNNKICAVVPPGIVAAILKRFKPVATYPRDGNLYVGEMEMSSFTRPANA